VEPGFFPLDEELALLPGSLTPLAHEKLVHLGTWIPSFEKAAGVLANLTGVQVSEATLRRQTEKAGGSYVAVQDGAVKRMKAEPGEEPEGAEKLFLSADGAMVPLIGGEWAEVKTLVVGEVQAPVERKGEKVVEVTNLSYFSRLAEAETFREAALVETQRRGVATAGQVAAVTDGAEWLQRFVDYHRPDAVRILDFPHAAEYVNQIGQALYGEGAPNLPEWLQRQLHELKHSGPRGILETLQALIEADPLHAEACGKPLEYLKKRQAHMQYPTYQADGWPIGDGATESANKLVVEARLKGSGMHWEREHVNPMLALRNVVCNNRWDEAWPQMTGELRQMSWQCRQARWKAHADSPPNLATPIPAEQVADSVVTNPAPPPPDTVASQPSQVPEPQPAANSLPAPRRPAANHPWRHSPIGKARYQPVEPSTPPKL
jgi:hypothetical protein